MSEILAERVGSAGLITLNRPKALNALSLSMVRDLAKTLREWQDDPWIERVALRGTGKDGQPFGAFCAGGDIRWFHEAAHAGDTTLEDFFTDEYALNHLIHSYPKPYAVFLDGIVMGGGMGISGHGKHKVAQGMRIVTERTKMAMPETNIGLFPDVGGGYFLSRCPGFIGEYLALTGHLIRADDAIYAQLADVQVQSARLPAIWGHYIERGMSAFEGEGVQSEEPCVLEINRAAIDGFFGLPTVTEIVEALEADSSAWAEETAAMLRKRSPLMLHVTLEQLRRGRRMSLADDLRMERDIVRNCFQLRQGAESETVEGIRALVIDKDQQPNWNPARIEDVTPDMVADFFESPWSVDQHPLRAL
ncbi:enoyl-CoA hydratase/isomerase family protein [Caenimonas sp. SL110]|uniref:enoyl-CoA hydratase/isomerase family protein n=1 Tax=Caenimonas sp. SL110 TaxID=1450524 RepID=UPI000654AE65|nr:enoyl-CoA hydratase/isomerase family protein [Caenimonas sp. SL110]